MPMLHNVTTLTNGIIIVIDCKIQIKIIVHIGTKLKTFHIGIILKTNIMYKEPTIYFNLNNSDYRQLGIVKFEQSCTQFLNFLS